MAARQAQKGRADGGTADGGGSRRSGRKPSRRQLHEAALARAAATEIPAAVDVCVIGGGAAGLAAAITAAEAGATTLVLETQAELGRTILATGNGRCNFANLSIDDRHYRNWDFVEAAFGERALDDVLAFFRASGMRWQLEGDRLYPLSFQAASVRNVLLARARRAGVIEGAARTVTDVEEAADGGWQVAYALERPEDGARAAGAGVGAASARREHVRARTVIIACGPTAPLASQTAEALGLPFVPTRPALCPVTCEPSPLAALDGRRVHGALSLVKGMFPAWHERGEVLLRSYGLSGMVTFNLSRRADAGDVIQLDLVPDLNKAELQQIVDPFASGTLDDGALDGVIDPEIAALVVRLARERWQPEGIDPDVWQAREDDSDSARAITLTKALPFRVTGFKGEQAQVHAGGFPTSAFSPETLAADARPAFFAAGEALDVDGDCGGYNLMWAWKSGMVAGAAAAREAAR